MAIIAFVPVKKSKVCPARYWLTRLLILALKQASKRSGPYSIKSLLQLIFSLFHGVESGFQVQPLLCKL
jgi:hypothetical protein